MEELELLKKRYDDKGIDIEIDVKDPIKSSKVLSSNIMKDFRQNITELFDIILKEADKIKNSTK